MELALAITGFPHPPRLLHRTYIPDTTLIQTFVCADNRKMPVIPAAEYCARGRFIEGALTSAWAFYERTLISS